MIALARISRRCLSAQSLVLPRGRFARREPLNEAELEALALLDPEPLRLDVAERAAQEVLPLQRHREHFEKPLDGPYRPSAACNVICQQQKAAWS